MVQRQDLIAYCSDVLAVDRFRDMAINGLQVEGRDEIRRLGVAVSASEQTIREALDWQADALLVHHGLFWGERTAAIAGLTRHRLKLLLANDLNLIAYHLPLDAHPKLGNNAELCRLLHLSIVQPFAEIDGQAIGFVAAPSQSTKLATFVDQVSRLTDRRPVVLAGGQNAVRRLAVVSGSGYSTIEEAAAVGCDVLLTGDVREPTMALARELGITVIAAGHEATERAGIQALATNLAEQFEIDWEYFPDPNPI